MKNNKQSLYTKYRPKNFDEVIGQKVAKDILINSIAKNKINHAYLFFGIRGTGKTTLARIFAKAINCENKKNHNPCGECDICKTIDNGSSFDIIEIDAASNNGVDEIRSIKENTSFLTTNTKYKVYIIDEVHMLTKAAFNALLKTLEEPPQNTIFLLATTEIQKIPLTVLSRVVIINLEVMSNKDIKYGLKVVVEGEEINYDDNALDYIVMVSGGSLRDAISSLETVLLYNSNLSVENVILALGLIKRNDVRSMLINDPMKLANEIDISDKDPSKVIQILLEVCMELLKSGNVKYINFLNSIINISNNINDPLLLKTALKTSLLTINSSFNNVNEIKNNNVSRETNIQKDIYHNIENNEKGNENIVDYSKYNANVESAIDSNSFKYEDNIKVKSDVENAILNDYDDTLNVITDYVDVNNYIYILKTNDDEELSKAKTRWKFIDNYITNSEYKNVISALVKTTPLASTEKTLVIGFHNEHQINEFKRISLSGDFFKFIKEILGVHKFVLPVNKETWSKLLAVKDKVELSNIHSDINIKLENYILNPIVEQKNKVDKLFGEGNVKHE